jgi:hypothetical protein
MNDQHKSEIDILETGSGSSVTRHSQDIWCQLVLTYGSALTHRDRQEVTMGLFKLNGFAATAASRLRNSPFSEAERRFFAPPSRAVKGSQYKLWKRHNIEQTCIDTALCARAAIFNGNLARAFSRAVDAAHHSQGSYAEIGRKVRSTLPRSGSSRPADPKRDELWQRILTEATRLAGKHPKYTAWAIAELIAKNNKGKRHFPKKGSIYKRLLREKSWQNKADTAN